LVLHGWGFGRELIGDILLERSGGVDIFLVTLRVWYGSCFIITDEVIINFTRDMFIIFDNNIIII
jgi:hypothetical protein